MSSSSSAAAALLGCPGGVGETALSSLRHPAQTLQLEQRQAALQLQPTATYRRHKKTVSPLLAQYALFPLPPPRSPGLDGAGSMVMAPSPASTFKFSTGSSSNGDTLALPASNLDRGGWAPPESRTPTPASPLNPILEKGRGDHPDASSPAPSSVFSRKQGIRHAHHGGAGLPSSRSPLSASLSSSRGLGISDLPYYRPSSIESGAHCTRQGVSASCSYTRTPTPLSSLCRTPVPTMPLPPTPSSAAPSDQYRFPHIDRADRYSLASSIYSTSSSAAETDFSIEAISEDFQYAYYERQGLAHAHARASYVPVLASVVFGGSEDGSEGSPPSVDATQDSSGYARSLGVIAPAAAAHAPYSPERNASQASLATSSSANSLADFDDLVAVAKEGEAESAAREAEERRQREEDEAAERDVEALLDACDGGAELHSPGCLGVPGSDRTSLSSHWSAQGFDGSASPQLGGTLSIHHLQQRLLEQQRAQEGLDRDSRPELRSRQSTLRAHGTPKPRRNIVFDECSSSDEEAFDLSLDRSRLAVDTHVPSAPSAASPSTAYTRSPASSFGFKHTGTRRRGSEHTDTEASLGSATSTSYCSDADAEDLLPRPPAPASTHASGRVGAIPRARMLRYGSESTLYRGLPAGASPGPASGHKSAASLSTAPTSPLRTLQLPSRIGQQQQQRKGSVPSITWAPPPERSERVLDAGGTSASNGPVPASRRLPRAMASTPNLRSRLPLAGASAATVAAARPAPFADLDTATTPLQAMSQPGGRRASITRGLQRLGLGSTSAPTTLVSATDSAPLRPTSILRAVSSGPGLVSQRSSASSTRTITPQSQSQSQLQLRRPSILRKPQPHSHSQSQIPTVTAPLVIQPARKMSAPPASLPAPESTPGMAAAAAAVVGPPPSLNKLRQFRSTLALRHASRARPLESEPPHQKHQTPLAAHGPAGTAAQTPSQAHRSVNGSFRSRLAVARRV